MDLKSIRHSIWSNGVTPHMSRSFNGGGMKFRSDFGLGRGGAVARHCALWHRDFIDRHHGLASGTVEHVDAALVDAITACFTPAAVLMSISEGWPPTSMSHRSWWVNWKVHFTWPVSMSRAVRPAAYFGIIGTVAAVLVGHLVAHRQVEHAEFSSTANMDHMFGELRV